MATTLVALMVLAGVAIGAMTQHERQRLFRAAFAAMQRFRQALANAQAEPNPFRDALRARTPRLAAAPAVAVVNVVALACMVVGPGTIADPDSLIGWGGNFGPRTTNGEWSRLVTAMFLHTGLLNLVINLGSLAQAGFLVERIAGRVAFVAVYVAAGVIANVVSLSTHPMEVAVGASGAIYGLYGFLLASALLGAIKQAPAAIPLGTLKQMVPVAGLFVLYNLFGTGLDRTAELAGLLVGMSAGVALIAGVKEGQPAARRVGITAATALLMMIGSAAALRGVTDVRPEIANLIAVEARTAEAYDAAVGRYRSGRIRGDALALVIDKTILPELQSVRARMQALDGVPPVHQPMVDAAGEFLKLRDASWVLRADGLRTANINTLRKADVLQRSSLEALDMLKSAQAASRPAPADAAPSQ
jgi:membrane associated rhomboid family serine protease